MGYYTGNGTTTNGGSTVSLLVSGPYYGGQFCIFQRVDSVVTVKNGVAESTAKNEKADMNLSSWKWDSGSIPILACKGTRKNVSFAQIAGSNLYALTISNDTLSVRGSRQSSSDSAATWNPTSGWST